MTEGPQHSPKRQVNAGLVVSAVAHVGLLVWTAVSFAVKPLEANPVDFVPVDVVSVDEVSKMMAGTKTAPKKETPKPLVEKKAEPKPAENLHAKVSDKPEITAATPAYAPPEPREVKPPEPTPPKEAKAEPAPKDPPKKQPEKKPEAQGPKKDEKKEPPKKEAKKEEAKPSPKKPEPKKVTEHKPEPTPERERSKFSADHIAALLDKRQPQRMAAAGEVINPQASLGTTRGAAPQLSQNEIDALRARIQQCWNPPAGAADARDLTVLVRIQFNRDGSLASEPRLITRPSAGYQQVAAESALRAIRRCAPYSFMPPAKYDAWKDIEVNFDPRDLFRG